MKSITYESNHAIEILRKLNHERKSKKYYSDITLAAGSSSFAGHKNVLGVFSDFFYKMFSADMREKYEKKANIQGVSKETLEIILDFIYGCTVTITSENVYNLIEAANYMEIPHLKEFCVKFLLDDVDVSNCLRIRAYSSLYNLSGLIEKANIVIAENFESVVCKTEFKELKLEEITEILLLEDKQVSSEEVIFHAMISWIKHDIGKREKFFDDLLRFVDLENLPLRFFRNVVAQEDLIMNSLNCTKLCFQTLISCSFYEKHKQFKQQFLALQGIELFKYDAERRATCSFPSTTSRHDFGSAIHHNGKIYVVGGASTLEVEVLDVAEREWGWTTQTITDSVQDGTGAAAVYEDCIYTYVGYPITAFGRCFNTIDNTWKDVPGMNERRGYFGLVASDSGLYAVGGYNMHNLNTAEYFDPKQGFWEEIPPMKQARQGPAVVFLNNKVYAIGGHHGESLKTVERFDILQQRWSFIADMNDARYCFGACVLDGKIYVAGGGSSNVEVYDPTNDVWTVEANIPNLEDVQFIASL